VISGGSQRQDSVRHGVEVAKDHGAVWVLVHDGARPLAKPELFSQVLRGARQTGAAVTAAACVDTVKQDDGQGRVARTLDRSRLWLVQTPQAFRLDILWQALLRAETEGYYATDEGGLMEWAGHEVKLVPGPRENLKITTPEDLRLAEGWLGSGPVRVGQGVDVHRLVPGRPLILGGVRLEHDLGLAGHSDADVLTHAVMDALLAAAGLGDIGRHFPDKDPAYADADSLNLLKQVKDMLLDAGWRPRQVSVTLMAQSPRIAPHARAMVENLARQLGLTPDRVNVAATTSEGLGFTGRGEGMAAWATAVIEPMAQKTDDQC
jgi:2-C-methyl-D-erythritol 2,4-cyclodiphosphate synthase